MTEIIPVSRRLIFRGALGLLAASVAAPAIVQANRLPLEWEGLARFFDHSGPDGRRAIGQAVRAGLPHAEVTSILLRAGRRDDGSWPTLMFQDLNAMVTPKGLYRWEGLTWVRS